MGNVVWLAGFGYYGTSAYMTVATTDVMNQMVNALRAVNLDLQAVVHADILVAEAGRQRLDELAKVYSSFFLAEGEGAVPVPVPPPTLSVREVAGIDLESPLEITVTATRANDKRRSYSQTADSK
jgi:enamine deaminase RidA (YjgF/YER057c/UK114 family)